MGQDNAELISATRAELKRAAESATPGQAQRILAGDSADIRLSLLVHLADALERVTPREVTTVAEL